MQEAVIRQTRLVDEREISISSSEMFSHWTSEMTWQHEIYKGRRCINFAFGK